MRQKIDIYLNNVNRAKEAGITFFAKNQGPIWKSMDHFAIEFASWLTLTDEGRMLQVLRKGVPELLEIYKEKLAKELLIKRAAL